MVTPIPVRLCSVFSPDVDVPSEALALLEDGSLVEKSGCEVAWGRCDGTQA